MQQNVIQSLVANDGKYILMPAWKGGQEGWGNLAVPSPYEEESQQQYPIGTKFVDDGRIYHYVQAGNSCTAGRLISPWNKFGTATSGDGSTQETGVIQAAAVVDQEALTLTDQGSATPANVFAGGYAMVYWEFMCLRIVSNTAEDDPSAGLFEITIDQPLRAAIASTSYVTCYRDIYADVRYLSAGAQPLHSSACCVSGFTFTDTYYAWGQTWGPCGIAGVDAIGAGDNEQGMYNANGAVYFQTSPHASNNTPTYQYVGALAGYTGKTGTTAGGTDMPGSFIFVNLQLAG